MAIGWLRFAVFGNNLPSRDTAWAVPADYRQLKFSQNLLSLSVIFFLVYQAIVFELLKCLRRSGAEER